MFKIKVRKTFKPQYPHVAVYPYAKAQRHAVNPWFVGFGNILVTPSECAEAIY